MSTRPKELCIIVDMDGTLCDNSHRKHYVEGEKKDFNKFNQECGKDKVNHWCDEIITGLHEKGILVFLVTGREGSEEIKSLTESWLNRHSITYDELFMRKEKDYRPDYVIKEEIYNTYIKDYFDVLFCIDDRKQVVDLWRSLGLTCLQCDEGNF